MEEKKAAPPPKPQKRYKQVLIITTIVASVLIGITVTIFIIKQVSDSKKSTPKVRAFPIATVDMIHGFTFYYLNSTFSTNYKLVTSSISYQNGVIVFELKNPKGSVLAFTEESTPPNYNISGLQADVDFQTGYGPAYITDAAIRTTGALFTSDNTWILINAPTPIGRTLMQQILDALKPYR